MYSLVGKFGLTEHTFDSEHELVRFAFKMNRVDAEKLTIYRVDSLGNEHYMAPLVNFLPPR